ncbi:MAG: phytanoyl-CoA dioxygenase family protein [Pseudomonadota bacterium]
MADGATVTVAESDLKPWLGEQKLADCFEAYDRNGYIIFNNVMPAKDVQDVKDALEPHLNKSGRNDFEGLKSNRVYALLAKSSVFVDMAMHPLALAFAERDLGKSCRLSACLAIKLHPGETVQPWHTDDGHLQIPRPRPAYGVSTFWAIDDTTVENGATEIIPGSHLWGDDPVEAASFSGSFSDRVVRDVDDDPGGRDDSIKATMSAGSLMIAKGTLWHRGGANRSKAPRLIVTPQYCTGWARQLENMVLAVPPDVASMLPKRAQELIGYGIHAPFMGYVDGMHPARTLAESMD